MADPIIEIQSGLVRGIVEKDEDGFDYYAFKGIPYAEPPIGELRFQDPVMIKKWNGVQDAKIYGPICAQYDIFSKNVSNEEDCLHLNVFTKVIDQPNAKKAVMVWIHGGYFYFGSGDDYYYGPQYLMRKDIVFVTVNYRLGVFGFLNLEDEIAPGNQGLKDQVMALQWVQQNIQVFGGNPNNVTVFGQSAGGASVHFLTLSPLAQGLFHKAISQSGVAFNNWSTVYNPKRNAMKICSLLGKDLKDSKSIVNFLKTIDTQKLRECQERLRVALGSLPFGPGVDVKSPIPFMPIDPHIAAERGVQVPFLIGHTSREGIFYLLGTAKIKVKEHAHFLKLENFSFPELPKEVVLKTIDNNFNLILSSNAEKMLNRYNLTTNQFRRLYYKNERVSSENLDKFVNLTGDLHFVEGIHRFVKTQAQRSSASTYMYQLSFHAVDSIGKLFITNDINGACHVDDLRYLFKMRIYDDIKQQQLKKGTHSYKVMERMTEMWTNFAKYGRPTIATSELIPIHWLPINDGTALRYMNIDEDLTVQSMLNIEHKYLSAADLKL